MGVGYPDSADEIDKTLPAPLKAARDGTMKALSNMLY